MSEQSSTDREEARATSAAAEDAPAADEATGQQLPSQGEEGTGELLEGTSASQTELPFAFVDGEPITELPKDLFIPPQALSVFLEAFEGPLDFLLYLIKRQNLDVLNIPIADISRQYTGYIDLMQDMQLELAGEYLVMAATLAEIKSRMLLPRPVNEEQEEGEDPRAELVRRLQEYERYKNAAERVDELPRMERENWPVSAPMVERTVVRKLPEVTLKQMVAAFNDVMSRAELNQHYHIRREALSVRERMTEILDTLRAADFTEFRNLLRADQGKQGVVASFLAVLELAKESLIEIVQSGEFAPIHVRAAGSDDPQPATGDVSTE